MIQKRYAPAANGRDNPKEMWNLTKKQWLVYYWILAHTYWNPNEQHYYIYKEKMPSGKIQKDVGVTAPTIRTAITKLIEIGAMAKHPYIENAYVLYHPPIYTSVDVNILKFCLAFHEYFGSDLVVFYTVLRRLNVLEGTIRLNLSEYAALLNRLKQNISKEAVYLMLSLYSTAGLIKMQEKVHNNALGTEVHTFVVSEVRDLAPQNLIAFCDKDESIDMDKVRELYETLLGIQ